MCSATFKVEASSYLCLWLMHVTLLVLIFAFSNVSTLCITTYTHYDQDRLLGRPRLPDASTEPEARRVSVYA